jgi:glycosyltransferase involved in cell wall biosynthesis
LILSQKNKKVLIITYYWPPSGGSGVQRWLKFVKYLPSQGWEPYVFTPENPSFAIQDESLLKDVPAEAKVIRFPIWEPYDIFFKLTQMFGKRPSAKPTTLVSGKKRSFFQQVSTWIRGNFFIPDPRRFWVKPSVAFLHDFLNDNRIEIIITTGPPHSLHLIGLELKKKNPTLRWLADFRDPWSEWGLLDSLSVGNLARRYHKKLEAQVLASADDVLTITPFYVRQFELLGKRSVQLLTNGFDEDDFQHIRYQKSDRFLIRHIGIVNEKCDPRPFMEAVGLVCDEHADFARYVQVEFIGEVHPTFRTFVDTSKMNAFTSFRGNIRHKELMTLYGASSLLVLILTGYKDAEGYLPGKLFEYLATGLPILGIGPVQGDAGTVLAGTGAGKMIDSDDIAGMKDSLLMQFMRWKENPQPVIHTAGIQTYSRKEITRRLTGLLLKTSRKENPSPALS